MTGDSKQPHVVVIGGGFAGLNAAKALKRAPVRVTLIDRRNHHLFQPLLYQVATAALSAPDIAAPIRKVLSRQKNVKVLLAQAESIDPERRVVVLDHGELEYDYLIVGAGAKDNYFGNDAWAEYAPGLKTIDDALGIRRKVLMAFEMAERESNPAHVKELLTFIVIGAGPTGVELAGALSEIARRTMTSDFRNIDPGDARVILLEGSPRVLPPFHESMSARAQEQLVELGVEVRTSTMVEDVAENRVRLKGGEELRGATILWGAGVNASSLGGSLDAPLDKGGRVKVEPDLSVPGCPEVFIAGDMAAAEWGDGYVPGLAPAAIQMGKHAARNIQRLVQGKPTEAFEYADKGMLATIGRSRAVAQIGNLRFGGFVAWMLWLVVHIFFLIGFRNRVAVLLDWTLAYVTFRRSARIVMEERHLADAPRITTDDALKRTH